MERYLYKYCGIEGYLVALNVNCDVMPIVANGYFGFYYKNDVEQLGGVETLLTYDDIMSGTYCGGDIMIAIVDDVEHGGKIQQFVSVEYYLKEKNINK